MAIRSGNRMANMLGGDYSDYDPYQQPTDDQAVSQVNNPAPPQPAATPTQPATQPQQTSAFDPLQQVGHNGSINGLNREQYRDLWGSSGAKNMQDLQNFLNTHGGKLINGKNGTVLTPFGEQIDMLANAGANDSTTHALWMGAGGVAGGQSPASIAKQQAAAGQNPNTLGTGGGGGGISGGGYTNSGQPTPLTPAAPTAADLARQAQEKALMDQLMSRAGQSLNLDGSDPIIKNQVDAYRAEQERARKDYLNNAAEQRSPYSTGAQDLESRMTAEALGQNVGSFQGTLIGNELTARRNEIQNALTQMGGILSDADKLALQKELGYLDASLQNQGQQFQNSQYYAGLNESDKQFFAQLAQQKALAGDDNAYKYAALNADTGYKYASLGQNQNQFLDDLGFRTGQQGFYEDAINRGLIGG